MKIASMKDFDQVYSFFTRPDFVGDITDDNSPHIFHVVKHLLQTSIVAMPSDGTLFVLTPINSTTYNVHLNTTQTDKSNVYTHTLKMAEWAKENTTVHIAVSMIPVIYESTLHYAKKIGMTQTGMIGQGFLKQGKRIDIDIMSAEVDQIIKELSWLQQ